MLFHFFTSLVDYYSFFNVFKYLTFRTGLSVMSSPAIGSDGTVYVGSTDNKLYAIKTDSKGPAKSPWPMFRQNAQRTGRVMK